MAELFSADTRELRKMEKDFKKLKPSQGAAIIRTVLNDQAFDSRKQAIDRTIPAMFHNRNKWIVSSILVEKAKGRNVKKMFSVMGAAKRWGRNKGKDFLGMAQQEKGGTIRKPGIETRLARSGGKFAGRVLASAKLGKLSPLEEETNYPGSGQSRVIAMLRILDRKNYKGGFKISRSYPKFKKGVYRFKGARIKLSTGQRVRPIQMVMDLAKRSVRTPRKPWMTNSVKKGVTKTSTQNSFKKAFKFFTSPRPPRN